MSKILQSLRFLRLRSGQALQNDRPRTQNEKVKGFRNDNFRTACTTNHLSRLKPVKKFQSVTKAVLLNDILGVNPLSTQICVIRIE